jgi:DNA-binding response OmpR family regulator
MHRPTRAPAELLQGEGCTPLCCAAGQFNMGLIEQMQANLLILELSQANPHAILDLLGELRRNPAIYELPVIVNSTSERLLKQFVAPLHNLGCVVLAKPFDLDTFFASVHMCLDTGRSETQRLVC